MWKYIVFWIVATWVSQPCPDNYYDQYTGRVIRSNCLVNHGEFEYDTLFQFFETRQEAGVFCENGKKNDSVRLIWVDSTYVPIRFEVKHIDSDLTFVPAWHNESDTISMESYYIYVDTVVSYHPIEYTWSLYLNKDREDTRLLVDGEEPYYLSSSTKKSRQFTTKANKINLTMIDGVDTCSVKYQTDKARTVIFSCF